MQVSMKTCKECKRVYIFESTVNFKKYCKCCRKKRRYILETKIIKHMKLKYGDFK